MQKFCLYLAAAVLTASAAFGYEPKFKKIVVTDHFNSEGAAAADFNNDGVVDFVAGGAWYEGPDFKVSHKIYEGENFDPEGYSDSFVNFADDINGDGWTDVIACPFPGHQGYWYENPKTPDGEWIKHESIKELGNESQEWADVDGDGRADLIFNQNGWYGFAKWDPAKAGEPWEFIPVSNENEKYFCFFHGVGHGDLNGDGRVDLLEMDGWWEQPENYRDVPWTFHPFKFSDAASNILVMDVNGDGLNDVVTAQHCHLYGLQWYKQVRGGDGEITFEKNVLIPADPDDGFFPKVSQLHSMAAADFNGDGVTDFVTGKRWWAHGSKGDVNPNDPAILMWWEVRPAGDETEVIPHIIDEDSGVGTQVWTSDMNKDGRPDVLVSNKKGIFVFLSEKE